MTEPISFIFTTDVIVEDRIRKEMGSIDELVNSITKFGLIQPIVLTFAKPFTKDFTSPNEDKIRLVAGGRRFAALKRLGLKELKHGTHFVWRYEMDTTTEGKLFFKGMELEENLKRKQLTWQEEISAKQALLETMEAIHGKATMGRPSLGGGGTGFGVNKLAAMLGESPAITSTDLQLAQAIKQFPSLRNADTKGAAKTQIRTISLIASTIKSNSVSKTPSTGSSLPPTDPYAVQLLEGDFRNTASQIEDSSVDLVITDLPYGSDVDRMSSHGNSLAEFDDSLSSTIKLLGDIAEQSFRVLKDDRYAIFFFGFVCYDILYCKLQSAGFDVNPVPFIWTKNTKSGENPNTRYCNSYEPVLVARKGNANFVRPGLPNVFECDVPSSTEKFQTVQKPLLLIQKFILDTTVEDQVVLDWCAGTGTTGAAAHSLRRKSILCEKEPSMLSLLKLRLSKVLLSVPGVESPDSVSQTQDSTTSTIVP